MIKEVIKYGEAEVTYRNKKLLSEKPILKNLFWETTLRCNAILINEDNIEKIKRLFDTSCICDC